MMPMSLEYDRIHCFQSSVIDRWISVNQEGEQCHISFVGAVYEATDRLKEHVKNDVEWATTLVVSL